MGGFFGGHFCGGTFAFAGLERSGHGGFVGLEAIDIGMLAEASLEVLEVPKYKMPVVNCGCCAEGE